MEVGKPGSVSIQCCGSAQGDDDTDDIFATFAAVASTNSDRQTKRLRIAAVIDQSQWVVTLLRRVGDPLGTAVECYATAIGPDGCNQALTVFRIENVYSVFNYAARNRFTDPSRTK